MGTERNTKVTRSDDAISVYEAIRDALGDEEAARKVLVVLEGMKVPQMRTVELAFAREKAKAILKEQPDISERRLARRLGTSKTMAHRLKTESGLDVAKGRRRLWYEDP